MSAILIKKAKGDSKKRVGRGQRHKEQNHKVHEENISMQKNKLDQKTKREHNKQTLTGLSSSTALRDKKTTVSLFVIEISFPLFKFFRSSELAQNV